MGQKSVPECKRDRLLVPLRNRLAVHAGGIEAPGRDSTARGFVQQRIAARFLDLDLAGGAVCLHKYPQHDGSFLAIALRHRRVGRLAVARRMRGRDRDAGAHRWRSWRGRCRRCRGSGRCGLCRRRHRRARPFRNRLRSRFGWLFLPRFRLFRCFPVGPRALAFRFLLGRRKRLRWRRWFWRRGRWRFWRRRWLGRRRRGRLGRCRRCRGFLCNRKRLRQCLQRHLDRFHGPHRHRRACRQHAGDQADVQQDGDCRRCDREAGFHGLPCRVLHRWISSSCTMRTILTAAGRERPACRKGLCPFRPGSARHAGCHVRRSRGLPTCG